MGIWRALIKAAITLEEQVPFGHRPFVSMLLLVEAFAANELVAGLFQVSETLENAGAV
jgi:hypothetical protein